LRSMSAPHRIKIYPNKKLTLTRVTQGNFPFLPQIAHDILFPQKNF